MNSIMAYLASLQLGSGKEEILIRVGLALIALGAQLVVFSSGLLLAFFHPQYSTPEKRKKIFAGMAIVMVATHVIILALFP